MWDAKALGVKEREKKVCFSTVRYKSGVLGSPWIFVRPGTLKGFTEKEIVRLGLCSSSIMEGLDKERSSFTFFQSR